MEFPSLILLVSGGHNMLVMCEGIGQHTILGTTLDDSVGEAFDKTARELNIEKIPGGPELEKLALLGDKNK
jgi:N6-L-threonylcarbamoyladenine synthase